jgi:uncharacterized BrkB/YihY/UPF0761 family membrane protein
VSAHEQARRLCGRLVSAAGRYPWVGVVVRVVRRDLEVGGALLTGALAFRLFIWLLPCCLLVAAVLGFTASGGRSPAELAREMGASPLTSSVLGQLGAQAERGRYLTALIALGLMCVAGLALGRVLDGIHARVWQTPVDRGLRPALGRAVRYTAALLGIIVGNLAAPLVGTAIGQPEVVIVLTSLLCYVGFGTVVLSVAWPPRWRQTLPGAVVVAVGIEGLHLVAVLYLPGKLVRASQLYGTLGVAAALLVWLALMARLVVLGLVLNAVLAESRE